MSISMETETEAQRHAQTTQLLRLLFKLPASEVLHDDFSCAIRGKILLHGRLYVCSSCIAFYSNIFGHETRKVLPFWHITAIHKRKSAYVNPAIEVCVSTGTTKKNYLFLSFFPGYRETCYGLCTRLLRQHQSAAKQRHSLSPTKPIGSSQLSHSGAHDSVSTDRRHGRTRAATSGGGLPSSASQESNDSSSAEKQRRKSLAHPSVSSETAHRSTDTEASPHDSKQSARDQADNESLTTEMSHESPKYGELSTFDPSIMQEYEQMTELIDTQLPIAVEDFYQEFLADDAKYSIQQYHKWRHDTDFSMTPWDDIDDSQEADGPVDGATRTVKYKMTLPKSSMGPDSTRVEKIVKLKQCLVKPSDHVAQEGKVPPGMALLHDTSARSLDVPYGDYFTNEDRWIISKCADDSTGSAGVAAGTPEEQASSPRQQCRVRIALKVNFNKSTMMSRIIKNKSTEGVKDFYQNQIEQMRKYIEQRGGDGDASGDSDTEEPKARGRSAQRNALVRDINEASSTVMREASEALRSSKVEDDTFEAAVILASAEINIWAPPQLASMGLNSREVLRAYGRLYGMHESLRQRLVRAKDKQKNRGIFGAIKATSLMTKIVSFLVFIIIFALGFFIARYGGTVSPLLSSSNPDASIHMATTTNKSIPSIGENAQHQLDSAVRELGDDRLSTREVTLEAFANAVKPYLMQQLKEDWLASMQKSLEDSSGDVPRSPHSSHTAKRTQQESMDNLQYAAARSHKHNTDHTVPSGIDRESKVQPPASKAEL